MSKSIYEKATDKNIITKQVVINTPTSAHLLPITADEKVIDEIQQALNELERLKKQEKLLKLYREKDKYTELFAALPTVELYKYRSIVEQIKELENEKTNDTKLYK